MTSLKEKNPTVRDGVIAVLLGAFLEIQQCFIT